jgi:hypothetical protein
VASKIEDIIFVLENPNNITEPKLRFVREKLWRRGYLTKTLGEYRITDYGRKLLSEVKE